jgi:hypothetical protein
MLLVRDTDPTFRFYGPLILKKRTIIIRSQILYFLTVFFSFVFVRKLCIFIV